MFELPELGIRITKEFLLSKNSEETYMSTYLGIPVQKGLQVSPLRSDHRPTASFYRNSKGDLIFHDFGNGFHGNFISVVMYIYKCDFVTALRIIAKDFGYIKSTEKPTKKIVISNTVFKEKKETSIQVERKPFSEKELQWWKSFGITESTLKKFNIYSCKNVFLNSNYFTTSTETNPIYGYYGGKKDNIELWRIYFPRKKSYRFISNWSSKYIQGSKQLPKEGKVLIVTKSLKDCAALYEFGITAVAPCSEVLFLTKNQLERLKLRFKRIIVIYDNDLAGISGLNKIKKLYPELDYFFIPFKYGAKDFSDLVKKYGIEKTKEFIEQFKEYYNI